MNTNYIMRSRIDRRVLVSYAIDPDVVEPLLPSGLRPTIHAGVAVGGICLIRLTDLRPRGVPRRLGLTTENVAHRFAVEWEGPSGVETGVFIARRDTSSLLTATLGGRAFPGVHGFGHFDVRDRGGNVNITYRSRDGSVFVDVHGNECDDLPVDSVYESVGDASEFFRRAPIGWSPTRDPATCEGVALHADNWRVQPLALTSVRSSWFEDSTRFPTGSVRLDSALVMRGIDAEWVPRSDRLCATPTAVARQ